MLTVTALLRLCRQAASVPALTVCLLAGSMSMFPPLPNTSYPPMSLPKPSAPLGIPHLPARPMKFGKKDASGASSRDVSEAEDEKGCRSGDGNDSQDEDGKEMGPDDERKYKR